MAKGFNMEFRSQQEFGWLVATWLFLSGSASGLFLLFALYALPLAYALLSLGAIVLGGAVLLFELGSPLRVWLALSRLGSSWLSRGALSVTLFVLSGALFVAPAFAPFAWLPWAEGSALAQAFKAIAVLCAVVIMLYPGFFLAQNRSIPFWNTALFAVISLGFAVLGASALALLASAWFGSGTDEIVLLAAIAILVNGVLVGIHLISMSNAGGAARESVNLLNRSPLKWPFWGGVFLVGLIVPLALLWAQFAVALAGAGILLGALLFRYCVLKAGVYVPAAMAEGGMDLSSLKRTSVELMREYAGMATHQAKSQG
jgi:formate-dependent nitrite reductase membrane component NrfD